ncbi:MAG: HTTM domain-containing protein, partial [Halobacteria archaeon]|nr:HTTM domain-containing protein [Halobacteria archaeon]
MRSRHLAAFYTDRGVLPTSTLTARYPVLNRISLHALSGDVWFQVLVFVVTGVFAALVVVGYRTTLVTAVSWVLLLSLQLRNPLVLNGGDGLFVRLFFWGTLLPLGERWSIDAARRGEAYTQRERVASVASAGLLTQVVVVYAVNAVLKLRGDLWLSGDAVRYVFSLDQFTVLLGEFVARTRGVVGASGTPQRTATRVARLGVHGGAPGDAPDDEPGSVPADIRRRPPPVPAGIRLGQHRGKGAGFPRKVGYPRVRRATQREAATASFPRRRVDHENLVVPCHNGGRGRR